MHAPLGDQAWGDGLGERLNWMIGQHLQRASLRINPPNLGPVEIKITMQNEQQASVTFTAQNALVREAIESAIPRLREMPGENNLQLVDVDVGQRGSEGQRAADQSREEGGGGDGFGSGLQDLPADSEVALAGRIGNVAGRGLVDDYA
ncbi:MAG: flagellar hook-length control protein FliK [Candidatus Sedimenticola endophacoides]